MFWCCYDILLVYFNLILLTWTIWRAPTNASKWRMGFNSAFKGLIVKYSCSVSFFVLYSGNTDSNCVSFEKFLNLSLVCVPNCVAFWKKKLTNHCTGGIIATETANGGVCWYEVLRTNMQSVLGASQLRTWYYALTQEHFHTQNAFLIYLEAFHIQLM